jgi:hypothetical protein
MVDLNQSFRSSTTNSECTNQATVDAIRRIKAASPQERKVMIAEFVKKNIGRRTKQSFLVEYDWTVKFTSYLNSTRPEFSLAINNRKLLDPSGTLRKGL